MLQRIKNRELITKTKRAKENTNINTASDNEVNWSSIWHRGSALAAHVMWCGDDDVGCTHCQRPTERPTSQRRHPAEGSSGWTSLHSQDLSPETSCCPYQPDRHTHTHTHRTSKGEWVVIGYTEPFALEVFVKYNVCVFVLMFVVYEQQQLLITQNKGQQETLLTQKISKQ